MELPRTASNLLFIQFDPHQKKLTLYLKMLTHTKKYLTHTKKLWCTPMKVWSILKRIDTCNHEGIQSTLAHHQNFLADSQFSLFIYLFIYLLIYLFILQVYHFTLRNYFIILCNTVLCIWRKKISATIILWKKVILSCLMNL